MIISARTVVIALVTLIVAITTTISVQTFTNAASAEPQQRQQLQQEQGQQLQLAIVVTNTTNTNGNDSISLSSPTSSPPPITMNIRPSIQTDFNPNATYPKISKFAYVDPFAQVIGDCEIGKIVLVAPFAVCRGDEGTPIRVGDYSNMQDGVILHALETTSHGKNMDDRRYSAEGSLLKGNDAGFKNGFAIYVGDKVSLAHGVQVHGPAYIGNDTFVGMKSFVFNAKIGKRVAIGVSSIITDGVTIPDNKFVPPGTIVTTQAQADALPSRVGSPYEAINNAVIHVNQELAKGYNAQTIQRLATEMEDELEQQETVQTGSLTGNPIAVP
jgi:carbonic anhydrase/acetyltransferase-like protein (isoleucine patch superfamily)